MKKILLVSLIATICGSTTTSYALQILNDNELSSVDAQALLNMENSYDNSQGINFSKLSIEALMELNVNIKTLQLGCGGTNNSIKAGCDIDISNISLSGLNPSVEASTQSPLFTSERAGTSAQVTNPFVEFAVKGNTAATREIVGFRLGAENIMGLLTLGTENIENPTDGIKSFSGYMKMAATNGEAVTTETKFGVDPNQSIRGNIKVDMVLAKPEREFTSRPGMDGHTGITVPSMKVNFSMPETIVSGQRISKAVVDGIRSTIPTIPLASGGDMTNVIGSPNWNNDQLYVDFEGLIGSIGTHAFFKMLPGSSLNNLNLDITFEQALNMIHNIPLNGTGGYLSLQSQAVKWQGSDAADIAQPGWWMSFKDPINLGYLKTQDEVDISYVLPQVAEAITTKLLEPGQIINVNFFEAIGSLLSEPVEKMLPIDVGVITGYNGGKPAELTLVDKLLQNQKVTPNCFGNYKFC